MEGSDGEGESGGFDTAANDDLRFFFETLLSLILWGKLGKKDFLENGPFGVVGFDVFAAEGAGYEGGLVLGGLVDVMQVVSIGKILTRLNLRMGVAAGWRRSVIASGMLFITY